LTAQSSISIIGNPTNPNQGGILINAAFLVEVRWRRYAVRANTPARAQFRCQYSIKVGLCGSGGFDFLCFSSCSFDNSVVTLTVAEIVPIMISVTFDPIAQSLAVVPSLNLSVDWNNFAFTCGSEYVMIAQALFNTFLDTNVKQLITAKINTAVQNSASTQIGVPQQYRPLNNLLIGYRVKNMTFVQDSYVLMSATMNMSVVFDNGTRQYYEFPDNFHAVDSVSTDWSIELAYQMATSSTVGSPLLNGARLNIDIFTAAAGCFSMLFSTFQNSTTLLDATMSYAVTVGGPVVTVSGLNTLSALLPFGQLQGTCQSDPYAGRPLVDASFTNVEGGMGMEFVAGNSAQFVPPGIVLQYKSVNVSNSEIKITAPPLPVTGDVVQQAIQTGLASRTQQLNNFLRLNPIALPTSLEPYFPYPHLSAIPVTGAGGYIEVVTQVRRRARARMCVRACVRAYRVTYSVRSVCAVCRRCRPTRARRSVAPSRAATVSRARAASGAPSTLRA
jgi:hypothetical protein